VSSPIIGEHSSPLVKERMLRIVTGMERHTQDLLFKSEITRRTFWNDVNKLADKNKFIPLDKFEKAVVPYREFFSNNIIG
jgi:hypothetical protein